MINGFTSKVKRLKSKTKILFRIAKIENSGHFGDFEPLGDGIKELKVNFAKGYGVYFTENHGKVIILLIGGVKSS